MTTEYWEEDEDLSKLKPYKTQTWIQVWKPGKREWKVLERDAKGKYTLSKKISTINVATPWIKNLTEQGLVTTVPRQFKALQAYLSAAPNMNKDAFETSIGYSLSEHDREHVNAQISDNFNELRNSRIRPFTLSTFFALEAGENFGQKIKNEIIGQFGHTYRTIVIKH